MIGVPFTRHVMPEWAMSLATQGYPIGTNLTYFTTKGVEVADARNQMVEKALEFGTRYLWFVDDDTAPPVFAARKLIYELEQQGPPFGKAMIAAGIYCSKEDPPYPIVFKGELGQGAYWGWKAPTKDTEGDVFECSGIGTGCMMIRMELFKHLEKPYFKTVDLDPVDTKVFKEQQTDDLYFCDKVTKAGFKILAHGGVLPLHWDEKTDRPFFLPQNSYPMKPREEKTEDVHLSQEQWKEKLDALEKENVPTP